jgi:glycosyltransferase involved in cell wall biosynthesis
MRAPLLVAFDGGILGAGPITGVGRSFLHTLGAYAARDDARTVLLLPPGVALPDLPPQVEGLETGAVGGPLSRRLRLPGLLRRLGADLLHAPFAALPWRAPCPMVATVHDLPWCADLPRAEPGQGLRARIATRFALRHAAAVLVPSAATLRDLEAFGRGRRARLELVPHGVPLPAEPPDACRAGPLLVIADDRPRKNLPRLLRAHAAASRRRPDLPALLRIGPGCRYVDEGEKADLLRSATALVALSLHEGFGMPVLEAFGHGAPVVCSDRGSLAELAGDAALLVDPTDEVAIAAALERICADGGLRGDLARRGRIRAAGFTPERTAAHWAAIHRRILG